MDGLTIVIVLLFGVFLVGTILRILGMLERKRAGDDIDRARLVFFFTGCLMLVCLIPLRLFELLSGPALAGDLAVVTSNFLGYALTYRWRKGGKGGKGSEEPRQTVRAYHISYKGRPYGICTKESIDLLLTHKLIKRRANVELIDDFKREARKVGVKITVLQSKDGQQTLLKVEGPPGAPGADSESEQDEGPTA
jgi:hypothetical protein